MAGFSDYAEDAILNSLFGKTSAFGALASAPTHRVALCTAAPTDAQTGTTIPEASYVGYARVTTAPADWNASAAGAGLIDNANAITFPQNTGVNQTVSHVALVDAVSGGNQIGNGALSSSYEISTNTTPEIAAGVLDITLT